MAKIVKEGTGPQVTSVEIDSHVGDVLEQLGELKAKALEMIGLMAERHAKEYCPVDTGRLRNSITHTYSGNSGFDYSYTDQYKSGSGGSSRLGKGQRTTYTGSVGAVGDDGGNTVYIGTNVEYAAAVELGTSTGRKPKPYLRPALQNHIGEYQKILRKTLEGNG